MRTRFILFIIIIICCAALLACGESFAAFSLIPDADLGDAYFEHLIENLGQCQNVYAHLFIAYAQELAAPIDYFWDNEDGYFELFEAAYKNWQSKYPGQAEIMQSNIPKLFDMNNRIADFNFVFHMETIKHAIDSYVSALYINSPEPPAVQEEAQAGEEESLFPPIDPADARANIDQYATADFLSKNPQKAVSDYLSENNIHVTRIRFDDYFTGFNQHVYPFRIEYKYRINYHTGDESKPQNASVHAIYYVTMDTGRNYAVAYVSDPAVMREIINPDDPTIKDFQ